MNRLTKFFIIVLLLTLCFIAVNEYKKRFIPHNEGIKETDGLRLIYEYEAERGED